MQGVLTLQTPKRKVRVKGVLTYQFAQLVRIFMCPYDDVDRARLLITTDNINYWLYTRGYKRLTESDPRINYLNYEVTYNQDRACEHADTGITLILSKEYAEPTNTMNKLPSEDFELYFNTEFTDVKSNRITISLVGLRVSNVSETFRLAGIHYYVLSPTTCTTKKILLDIFDIGEFGVSAGEPVTATYSINLK